MRHAFMVVLCLAGCSRPVPPPPTFDPVGKSEAETFGQRFAALLADCHPDELAPLWNADVTARRSAAAAAVDSSIKDGLVSAFTSTSLWKGQCPGLKVGNAKSRYLGVRSVEGAWHPIVRILGDSGLNYAELELGKFGATVQAVDAIYYNTGEPLSRTMSRLMVSAQKSLDDGTLGDGDAMMRITARVQAGDDVGALALIRQLPPALRQDKTFMLMEIGLDPGDDEARYLAAIDRFEKAFPGDPSLDLVSIDGFFLRKDFGRLFATLDRLAHRIDDPYLDVMRALALREQGKLDKAIATARRATEREPDLEDAWDALGTTCLAQKDFGCAVSAYKTLAERFDALVTDDVVSALEGGDALIASAEWKAWRATIK